MSKTKPTRCARCGGKSAPFTMFANASTGESYVLCAVCMGSGFAEQVDDLAEIDEMIKEHEEIIQKLEEIVKATEEPELPAGLEDFTHTPLRSYKMAQMTLAGLKYRRLELLGKGVNKESLQYELDKKIGEEKYEEAGALQKKLDELKAAPKKKKKPVNKQHDSPVPQPFGTIEGADRGCVRCHERFPKPPGLFYGLDLGNCHEMCLPCCAHEVPKYVKTVKMADEMIAEMEKFSGMMDKMAMIGKYMAGEYDDLSEEEMENLLQRLENGETGQAHSPGQDASQMMIKALTMRRDFLARTNEDEEMAEAANLLNDLVKKVFGDNAIPDLDGYPEELGGEAKIPPKKRHAPKAAPKKSGNKGK